MTVLVKGRQKYRFSVVVEVVRSSFFFVSEIAASRSEVVAAAAAKAVVSTPDRNRVVLYRANRRSANRAKLEFSPCSARRLWRSSSFSIQSVSPCVLFIVKTIVVIHKKCCRKAFPFKNSTVRKSDERSTESSHIRGTALSVCPKSFSCVRHSVSCLSVRFLCPPFDAYYGLESDLIFFIL